MDDLDSNGSTIPGSNRQIEMFEKGMGPELSMPEYLNFVADLNGYTNITQVLKIAAFMLCCDVIAQDISKCTLRLREHLENGTSKIVMPKRHEMAALLATEPNKRHTWTEYVEMSVLWFCLTQNSYSVVLRANDGTPLELIPLQDGRVIEKINGRDTFYEVTASTMQEQALLGRSSATFNETDMIHVRGRMLDGMHGYSTLVVGADTLKTTRDLLNYRDSIFTEEGQMRGIFERKNEGTMSDVAFTRLRMQFKELMRRFKENKMPVVLEDGVTFKEISAKPNDAEVSKQFEAQVNEVCRLLRVPPHKVFALGNVKYENLETMEKAYVGDTLKPVAQRFEQRYGRILLSKKDRLKYFFEFDRGQMTLHDTKAVTERTIRSAERGLILVDEARAEFGWQPLPNGAGQVRYIPVNMNVVGDKNEVIIGASAPADDAAPAEDEEDTGTDDKAAAEKSVGLRLIK